ASSGVLSDDLLGTLEPNIAKRIIWAAQVDLRDRFYWDTLSADYVLIGTPTPTHRPAGTQRVITLPAEEIRSHVGIGRAFEKFGPEYSLPNNIVGQLYKKVRSVYPEEVRYLADELYKYYPEWRSLDRNNLAIPLVSAAVSLGDVWGTAVQKSSHEL